MDLEINIEITLSIDRFEENYAVCENINTREFINVPITELPENAQEGSILIFKNGKYFLDLTKTKLEQKKIQNIVNNLFKRNT